MFLIQNLTPPPSPPKGKNLTPWARKMYESPGWSGLELTDIESTKSIIKIKVKKILQFPE